MLEHSKAFFETTFFKLYKCKMNNRPAPRSRAGKRELMEEERRPTLVCVPEVLSFHRHDNLTSHLWIGRQARLETAARTPRGSTESANSGTTLHRRNPREQTHNFGTRHRLPRLAEPI